MNKVYLLIGGNTGDRLYYLKKTREKISKEIGTIIKYSAIYETEPWGFQHESKFLNQCLLVDTNLAPYQILESINNIEKMSGRKRNTNFYESRTIDIDILFYNDVVMNEKELTIPHKEFQNRNFALIPMAEISPGHIHPILKKSVSEILLHCTDHHKVVMYSE